MIKPLDEVRKAFEYCLTPERGCTGCPGHIDRQKPCYIWGEALFYLNEYATSINNKPLTWSELQQMQGKPVWVEKCHDDDPKGWLLVLRKTDDVINCTTKWGNSFYLFKSEYGKKWNAYRKERNDADPEA